MWNRRFRNISFFFFFFFLFYVVHERKNRKYHLQTFLSGRNSASNSAMILCIPCISFVLRFSVRTRREISSPTKKERERERRKRFSVKFSSVPFNLECLKKVPFNFWKKKKDEAKVDIVEESSIAANFEQFRNRAITFFLVSSVETVRCNIAWKCGFFFLGLAEKFCSLIY